MRSICSLTLLLCVVAAPAAYASHGSYFYVGAGGGDFYDENNWDLNPAAAPASGVAGSLMFDHPTNPLFNSTTAQIEIDLVIDGDTVVASGVVDIGRDDGVPGGSLTMTAGSSLTAQGGDFDYNQGAGLLSLTDATLHADDDIIIQAAAASFSGGAISADDNIQFENEVDSLIIDGTTLTTTGADGGFARIWFDHGNAASNTSGTGTSTHSISNATFNSWDDLGIRFGLQLAVTDSDINLGLDPADGLGAVENVFGNNDPQEAADRLTLLGASTLAGDAIEDGIDLFLGGTSTATLRGGEGHILAANPDDASFTSRIVFTSLDSKLTVSNAITTDSRALIINDFTGATYLIHPDQWNDATWNGLDAITDLQIITTVPEPSTLLLGSICFAAAVAGRRRRQE